MSYVLDFAPDARLDRRELSIPLQEIVLDELDRLLLAPPANDRGAKVYDFVHPEGGSLHYVFIRAFWNHRRQVLTVAGVAHFVKHA